MVGETENHKNLEEANRSKIKSHLDLSKKDSKILSFIIQQEDLSSLKKDENESRYGIYSLCQMGADESVLSHINPQFGQMFFIDTAMTGNIPNSGLAADFSFPRYLKDYFYSLDVSLLRDELKE